MRSKLSLAAAAVILALASAVFVASPAAAHDQLLRSDPAPDARLEAAPAAIELEFSADVLTIGAVVIVADGEGNNWADGEPTLDGAAVVVPVREGMPDAGYEIAWRVVSGDGHPITGLIHFTIGEGEPYAAAAPADQGATEPSASEQQGAQEFAGILRVFLIGAVGAAIAALIFVAIIVIRRRAQRAP